jgi:hypothetical protein
MKYLTTDHRGNGIYSTKMVIFEARRQRWMQALSWVYWGSLKLQIYDGGMEHETKNNC